MLQLLKINYVLIHYTHLKYIQKYIGKYITIIFFFFGLKWNSQKKNRKKLLFPIKRLYSLLDNASNYLPIVGCVSNPKEKYYIFILIQ